VFITLFTEDLERSKAFYQDVFGLRADLEDENSAVFSFENTGIKSSALRPLASSSAREPSPAVTRGHGSYSRSAWTTSTRCARN
jgi:catechol 2,3-dioxygenase-like lactoylglutathione lyase family enzyme